MRLKATARDGTKIVFREPHRTDARKLMMFINQFVSEPRSGLLINRKVNLKDEREWLRGWIADIEHKKGVLLLVEINGRIRGTCSIIRQPWKSSHVGEIGIGIGKDARGKGIGEMLMNRAIDLARKRMRGLEIIQLKAFSYNQRALRFYTKLGFIEVGRVPDVNKEDGEYFDDVYMVKKLRRAERTQRRSSPD